MANAFVILDEAQNTTPVQMKMFLTRLGENARMAVTGDLSQIDLPRGTRSGLSDALDTLDGVEGIAVVDSPRPTWCATRWSRASSPPTTGATGGARSARERPPRRAPHEETTRAARRDRDRAAVPALAAGAPRRRRARRATRPRAALAGAAAIRQRDAELSLVLADDAMVRALNRDGAARTGRPTCCPSPSSTARRAIGAAMPEAAAVLLGDVVLAYETVAREAAEQGKPLADHLAISSSTACCICWATTTMTRRATRGAWRRWSAACSAGLGVADPYRAREAADG